MYDFEKKVRYSFFHSLSQEEQEFVKKKAYEYRLSANEIKQLTDMAIDLAMWDEKSLRDLWVDGPKKEVLKKIKEQYERIKTKPKNYDGFEIDKEKTHKIRFTEVDKKLGFGMCPVASPKTRCCNLWTLDMVESCGYDCSYCSIQSFYNEDTITFNTNLKEKLLALNIDPGEIYHIGTGQSSDSLMWGNRGGVLEALIAFAEKYPNVILELKTKSDNVKYLLEHDYPPNIIVTWSLNPQTIIDKEERLTASLQERLEAAKKIHDKGRLVGFHFHPMVWYEGWQQEYGEIFDTLIKTFDPSLVALVSLGTLTFIKPVIKKLRKRAMKSKILQMPLTDAAGKLSYPLEIKEQMFRFAYDALAPWRGKVFFYMCMEDHSLWKKVFGYEYPTNESFELDMKYSYLAKILQIQNKMGTIYE
ncbi:spore photoproduct lyase [Nitratiruptor sp. YY08-14]|nr:spore photoproduct lyase [Nitratiruptor sp. YY08-10]BCD63791.1 spore photoproduct lyase [Nitratiruptor sp. YY08-14]